MDKQHTPGPWAIRSRTEDFGVISETIQSQSGKLLAEVWSTPEQGDERKHNARLMVASPDLYESCVLAKKAIEGFVAQGIDKWDADLLPILNHINASIGKVKAA